MPGSTQGQPSQNGQGDGEEAQTLTIDDVNTLVNKAITSRLKDFSKTIEKTLGETVATALTPITTKLEELGAQKPPTQQQDPKGETGKIEDHPFVRGLKKQLDDIKAERETEKTDREKERGELRAQKLRAAVNDELLKNGIDPARAKHALGFLVDTEKRVSHDDEENLVMRGDDGQNVDLATGIKSWAKSDDAKTYMPPKGTKGSGNTSGGKKPNASGEGAPIGQRLANFVFGAED